MPETDPIASRRSPTTRRTAKLGETSTRSWPAEARGDRGEVERRTAVQEASSTSTPSAWPTRRSHEARRRIDPDERVPVFVFAAEPTAQRVHGPGPAHQAPDRGRAGRARPPRRSRRSTKPCASSSPRLNASPRPSTRLQRAAEGSAGPGRTRPSRPSGGWPPTARSRRCGSTSPTSVNGTLDRESGAIEFADRATARATRCTTAPYAGDCAAAARASS